MLAKPRTGKDAVLGSAERMAFEAEGYVRIRGAFSRDLALRMQKRMWQELRTELGIERDDRTSWRHPARDLRAAKFDFEQDQICTARLSGAIDDLVGAERWTPPANWGRVLTTFPDGTLDEWSVPRELWHWDYDLRGNVAGMRFLFLFLFFSTVDPGGGGTLIVSGSHRLLERFFRALQPRDQMRRDAKLRKLFLQSQPWLRLLSGLDVGSEDRIGYFMDHSHDVDGIPVRVVELTGAPGDVTICHPLLMHTVAPNRSDQPRFMRAKHLQLCAP